MFTTDHFNEQEFIKSQTAENLGIDNTPSPEILAQLHKTMASMEVIRMFLGFPIMVHSGYRSPALNHSVGGAPDSQHMKGEACDFTCPEFGRPIHVASALISQMKPFGIDQMIMEGNWVHVSFTSNPRNVILSYRNKIYIKGIVG